MSTGAKVRITTTNNSGRNRARDPSKDLIKPSIPSCAHERKDPQTKAQPQAHPRPHLLTPNRSSKMAELMFGLGQTKKKKEVQRKVADTKKNLRDVNMAVETVEGAVRNEQHNREKDWKATKADTKTNLRDVNMAVETVESSVRKEQHDREKDWKATGANQKKANTNFDMARALFN